MSTAFKSANILLPKPEIDHEKWAVVACDQYTSEPDYWNQVAALVGDAPSTYKLTLPEIYLNDPDVETRLNNIQAAMDQYLKDDIFDTYENSMIYVERTDGSGHVRQGLVGAIDLEAYDFHKGSSSPVRATEATIIERIPPRIRVRQHATMELPHIMILIDDKEGTVIEPLADKKDLKTVYDFDMMQGGGHLKGQLLDEKAQKQVLDALDVLGSPEHFADLYGMADKPVLLFAMGDGNHSLATAKEFYEQLKAANPDKDLSDHPARYALVEIVNLHSPALAFEAIHRIVTDIDVDAVTGRLMTALGLEAVTDGMDTEGKQVMTVVKKGECTPYVITNPSSKLTVGSLQNFLDQELKDNGGTIDYIHGIDVVKNLSMADNSLGFLLPDMGKEELFPTVIVDGALPRKTFSMGHAEDKRFYMECRKIR